MRGDVKGASLHFILGAACPLDETGCKGKRELQGRRRDETGGQ